MQETTAGPTHGGTGSATIADIVSLAAERYGERPAARFKRDGEWREVSYTELGETVSEIARGLIDLGLEAGDRVALLCTTRVEWTLRGLRDHVRRAPSSCRSTRPTRPRSARGWRATPSRASSSARTPRRWRRSSPSATELPKLEAIISIEPADGAISLDELRERGRGRDAARGRRARRRPSSPRTRTRSSTRRARPARRRAACSRTATTARSPACARRSTSSRRARSSTSTCRSRTPTRC